MELGNSFFQFTLEIGQLLQILIQYIDILGQFSLFLQFLGDLTNEYTHNYVASIENEFVDLFRCFLLLSGAISHERIDLDKLLVKVLLKQFMNICQSRFIKFILLLHVQLHALLFLLQLHTLSFGPNSE